MTPSESPRTAPQEFSGTGGTPAHSTEDQAQASGSAASSDASSSDTPPRARSITASPANGETRPSSKPDCGPSSSSVSPASRRFAPSAEASESGGASSAAEAGTAEGDRRGGGNQEGREGSWMDTKARSPVKSEEAGRTRLPESSTVEPKEAARVSAMEGDAEESSRVAVADAQRPDAASSSVAAESHAQNGGGARPVKESLPHAEPTPSSESVSASSSSSGAPTLPSCPVPPGASAPLRAGPIGFPGPQGPAAGSSPPLPLGSPPPPTSLCPMLESCLPLNATIGDIVLRLVKEILQPVLARDIAVDPPSPFRFTSNGMAKGLELSPLSLPPGYVSSLLENYAEMGTAGSCFYCVSAPCVCAAFAPPLPAHSHAGLQDRAGQAGPVQGEGRRKRSRESEDASSLQEGDAAGDRNGNARDPSFGHKVRVAQANGAAERAGPAPGASRALAPSPPPFQDNLRQMCLFFPYSSVPPPKLIDTRYLCLFLSASADSPGGGGPGCGAARGLGPFAGLGVDFASDERGEGEKGKSDGKEGSAGDKPTGDDSTHFFLKFGEPRTKTQGDGEDLVKGFPDHARVGWELVEEVTESLEAIFNTIQMDTVEDRREALTVPDEFYAQNYWEWRQFLLDKAPTGASVSRTFGRSLLRSLLLATPGTIAKDLHRTPISFAAGILFFRLCEEVGIEPETRHVLWRTVASSQPEMKSRLVSESGLGFLRRDLGSAKEEEAGLITFKCVTNDRQPFSSRALVTVKNIFSRQLPKMPREYIVRLVFDRNHYTFCLNKEDTIIGGCCFRPYFQQKFAEIAFLAVTSTEQVKGYGTRLMNHLKEHVKKSGIEYFLTYADNFAVGYFRKQGFTQKISMPRERWYGYIKDYEGGTLMECHINPRINYLRLSEMLHDQQQVIKRATLALKPLVVYQGLDFWKKNPGQTLSPSQIPGLLQCGWHPGEGAPRAATDGKATAGPEGAGFVGSSAGGEGVSGAGLGHQGYMRPLHDQIMDILDALGKHHSAWPFLKPVSREEAPDYYDVIQQPTDISTMKKKCKKKHYTSAQMFADEVQLMFKNCRQYNHQQTIYYKYANELDKFVTPKIQALKQAFQQQQKQLAGAAPPANRNSRNAAPQPMKTQSLHGEEATGAPSKHLAF